MAKKNRSILVPLLCIVLGCGILYTFVFKKDRNADIATEQTTSTMHNGVPELTEIPEFTTTRPEQIITHTGYTVSYNPDWRVPNWVAYELTREETTGEVERAKKFEPDPYVKGVCPESSDYTRSGYDRGHMAPAGDMKWDAQAMHESFYLTNVCPQNHNLNKGDWKSLEQKIRYWANKHNSVYVVCGPILSNNPKCIGSSNVAVPDGFFKVCLAQVEGQWQAIGFIFDNKAGHRDLKTYCKSIDEVEEITGIDFFPKLEDNLENQVEARYNVTAWEL